jgi:hypothetical protein
MVIKKAMNKSNLILKFLGIASPLIVFSSNLIAQLPPVRVPQQQQPEDDLTWWYIALFFLFLSLAAAIGWMVKSRKGQDKKIENPEKDEWDSNSVDADKELEWFRKHSKSTKNKKNGNSENKMPDGLPQTSKVLNKKPITGSYDQARKKAEMLQFQRLPIHGFLKIEPARPFSPLAIKNDPALMSAIEQAHDEFEEDEKVRELAVRVLAAFKSRNSIEALADMALYDLSASLRSKAVTVLAEFNHESVFEALLLACADPTREVRAAAAKALFSVDFDRSDAWTRIAETGDQYRMVQAARAAIEGDLVDRSIDRLIHKDQKYAYEAFALLALLIKAGETKEIFEAIENQRDKYVKMAVLHVLKVAGDERNLHALYAYVERNSLPEDLGNFANEVIKSISLVPA